MEHYKKIEFETFIDKDFFYKSIKRLSIALLAIILLTSSYLSVFSLLKPINFNEQHKKSFILISKIDSLNNHLKNKHFLKINKENNDEKIKKDLKIKTYKLKMDIFSELNKKNEANDYKRINRDTVVLKQFKIDTSVYIPLSKENINFDTTKLKIIVKKVRYVEENLE